MRVYCSFYESRFYLLVSRLKLVDIWKLTYKASKLLSSTDYLEILIRITPFLILIMSGVKELTIFLKRQIFKYQIE